MRRNREVIRQWGLLQKLVSQQSNTIASMARDLDVNARTIRRDLEALQAAEFPIYDRTVNGTKFWRLEPKELAKALARNSLGLNEVCALYSSRALLKALAGSHLFADLERALDKIEAALPAGMRKFLDRLPSVVTAKTAPGRRRTANADLTTRLFEAATLRKVVTMRYDSRSSGRVKDYEAHPYQLLIAEGGLYLHAFVPAYNGMRTFLTDRIERLTVEERTFQRIAELGTDVFSRSLGVYSGPPERVERVQLRFTRSIAPFVRERHWHESQQIKDQPDGSIVLTMRVSDDYALRQWILGFGRSVRVLGPDSLVDWATTELQEARRQYEPGSAIADSETQPGLPFFLHGIAEA